MLRPYNPYAYGLPNNMPSKSRRRNSLRLSGYDYTQPGAYFVTMNTHQRECLFGEIIDGVMLLNEYGSHAKECWIAIPEHFPNVELGVYVIMPNHVHGIIIITDRIVEVVGAVGVQHAVPLQPQSNSKIKPGSLNAIVRSYKSALTKQIHEEDEFSPEKIWQRSFHDRIIRNKEEWRRIHLYIEANPTNWQEDRDNPVNL